MYNYSMTVSYHYILWEHLDILGTTSLAPATWQLAQAVTAVETVTIVLFSDFYPHSGLAGVSHS